LSAPFSKPAPNRSKATVSHDVENEKFAHHVSTKCLASYFDLRALGFFKGQVSQGGVDIHHVVEGYIQRLLKIDKILWDTTPGVPLPRNKKILDALNADLPADKQLKAIHKGMEDGGISGILQSRIPVDTNMDPQDIINELHDIYFENPNFKNLWPPARDYLRDLQQHEFLDSSLSIPR